MTSRQLRRWAALSERRARAGWWTSRWLVAAVAGAALAALVEWRAGAAGPRAASHTWFAVALVAHGLAYLRVPFHMYWRADAALLAQLPIEGRALFDVALWRCARAAAATALTCALGAIPLALLPADVVAMATRQLAATPIVGFVPSLTPLELALRHVAYAGALGLTAGLLVPAVVVWAASLVIEGIHGQRVARSSAGTVLGAIPGAAGVIILSSAISTASWLVGAPEAAPAVLGALAGASIVALVVARGASAVMAAILRDVSALDRQRLATLEIRPPTALERGVASLLGGDASLVYRKDARLMRRRYPMAFALGALIFLVLAIVGLARPADPVPWLAAAGLGGALYAAILGQRVRRPPIELPRQVATLPISHAALARAKLAWPAAWALVFVVAPLVFALIRR